MIGTAARAATRAIRRAPTRQLQQRLASTEPVSNSPKAPPTRNASRIAMLALFGLTSGATGAYLTFASMRSAGLGFYSDEASLTRFAASDEEALKAEAHISAHPLVASLRERKDLTESRPHMKMPAAYRARNLTGEALMGPGKIVVPPRVWTDGAGKELTSVTYVGDDLCGHPGIVHGGLLATMLDEGLARCCFAALPHSIAVTANLSVNYKKPTPAGSYLVLRAETTKVEGRKAWVKGRIELLAKPGEEATVLAEATGLFISPKYAAVMPRIT